MFPTFKRFTQVLSASSVYGVIGGQGPAVLLLHGYPQTHAMWHKVAPQLSQQYTVIAPDLRGYGRSAKPQTDKQHSPYSKRAMATDLIELMDGLGFNQFCVVGHDRGGRVAHRMAKDHPERVTGLCVLDIAPTREMYQETTELFAKSYWHWFFLIQPHPFPENLINSNAEAYLKHKIGSGKAGMGPFSDLALTDYLTAWSNPATVHASCEDYRAAATIDVEHDNEDGTEKVECPVLTLWGEHGIIDQCFEPLSLWRERAHNVSGKALPSGHYIAEEIPEILIQELIPFLSDTLQTTS